jgi:thiopurine S-methyltransferase
MFQLQWQSADKFVSSGQKVAKSWTGERTFLPEPIEHRFFSQTESKYLVVNTVMIDASFWHERWQKNEIGFHEPKPNPLLVIHFTRIQLRKGARVFVPLCGKTLDIGWLLSKRCSVVGAELSEVAIKQLFAQLRLEPKITKSKGSALLHYSAENIDIFVGDIFKVGRQALGRVDAVYDRAALVALPEDVRKRYATHLIRITHAARQLLVTFEYDQSVRPGPPFSISNTEIVQRYSKTYDLILLSSAPIPGGLKGKCPATENLWLLKRRSVG